MAFLGLKTRDAGLGGGSVADVLIKALTGDPEREMALARGRADLDLNEYRQRQMEASAAQAQAEADTTAWELNQRQTNLPVIADYYAGLVEEPVPVTTPGAVPAPAPGLPDPVAIDAEPIPLPLPDYAFNPRAPSTVFSRQPDITAAAEPAPVYDTPFTSGPQLAPDEDAVQLPQPDVLPGEVVPPSPEEMAAYEREREAAKARAGLIIGGGGNAEQMGKGLGVGEGIIKSGSDDPETRAQANLLYAGKTAAETAGATSDLIRGLRKDFAGTPAFQEWQTINTGYENMLSAMQSLTDLPEGDMRRGPADMRMIYSYLKMLDPNTGVKEGEYASAREAGGNYASLWNLYDRVVSGAVLDQDTRSAFLQEAYGMHEIATRKLAPLIKQYRGEAEEFKVDPGRIIQEMPTHERPTGGDALPSGVDEESIARVMRANPGLNRREAIAAILAHSVPEVPAGTGGGL